MSPHLWAGGAQTHGAGAHLPSPVSGRMQDADVTAKDRAQRTSDRPLPVLRGRVFRHSPEDLQSKRPKACSFHRSYNS